MPDDNLTGAVNDFQFALNILDLDVAGAVLD
jgi:hypothetical protein